MVPSYDRRFIAPYLTGALIEGPHIYYSRLIDTLGTYQADTINGNLTFAPQPDSTIELIMGEFYFPDTMGGSNRFVHPLRIYNNFSVDNFNIDLKLIDSQTIEFDGDQIFTADSTITYTFSGDTLCSIYPDPARFDSIAPNGDDLFYVAGIPFKLNDSLYENSAWGSHYYTGRVVLGGYYMEGDGYSQYVYVEKDTVPITIRCDKTAYTPVFSVPGTDYGSDKPGSFKLHPCYPNPFNSTTKISFELPAADNVRLEIYNVLGRKIKTLIDRQMESGEHTVTWNGTDESGHAVSSGVYYYVMHTPNHRQTREMILMK